MSPLIHHHTRRFSLRCNQCDSAVILWMGATAAVIADFKCPVCASSLFSCSSILSSHPSLRAKLRDLAGDLRYSEPDSLAATLLYQAADEIDRLVADAAAGGL